MSGNHLLQEILFLDDGRYVIDDSADDYVLGEGTYGVVVRATDTRWSRDVAIKRQVQSSELRRLVWEVLLLKHFTHVNILNLYSLHLDILNESFTKCYIVGEIMDTSLQWVIFDSPQDLTEEHVKLLFYQLLLGINHMHTSGVMHRDLKPANVLLDSQCTVKLCDFGLARKVGEKHSDYVVTRWYRAPELVAGLAYGYPVDIWSIGVMLAELITRRPLFPLSSARDDHGRLSGALRGKQMLQILQKIGTPTEEDIAQIAAPNVRMFLSKTKLDDALIPHLTKHAKVDVSPELRTMIHEMLQFNPVKRPTAEQLLRSKYFTELFTEEEFQASIGSPLPSHWAVSLESPEKSLRELLVQEVLDFRYHEDKAYQAHKEQQLTNNSGTQQPQQGNSSTTHTGTTTPLVGTPSGAPVSRCDTNFTDGGTPMRCNSENVELLHPETSGIGWPDEGQHITRDTSGATTDQSMEEYEDDDDDWAVDESEMYGADAAEC